VCFPKIQKFEPS